MLIEFSRVLGFNLGFNRGLLGSGNGIKWVVQVDTLCVQKCGRAATVAASGRGGGAAFSQLTVMA